MIMAAVGAIRPIPQAGAKRKETIKTNSLGKWDFNPRHSVHNVA